MRAPTVTPQHARSLRAIKHLNGERRIGPNHEWPCEEGVWTQRDKQQGVDARPHDRAPGREGVRRRTCRGRHDDPVTAEG